MTEREANRTTSLLGVLAEFDGPEELAEAARKVRAAGYQKLEAFSPFPIHGLDEVLAIPASRLPWLVLVAGVMGGIAALGGQWWTNAIDYPYIISGKPLFSLPANIPVTFEVIILCSAFAAFFGMLLFSRLPALSNPLHRSQRFLKATTDGFFLMIDAADGQFAPENTSTLLRDLGASSVEDCRDIEARTRIPRPVFATLAVLAAVALVPPLLIARARATTSEEPPLSWFTDMDFQPKFKSQTESSLFADGRAMRPPVTGTVARGELQQDDRLYRGVEPEAPRAFALNETGSPEPNWAETIPLPVTGELMRRGRQRYNVVCATCHGRAGDGDGPVSVRALALEQGTWVPPTSIHADHVRKQPAGKLFSTITNGVRKMPGYGDQISPEDRWAIVLYLRALQRTRDAAAHDLTPDELARLRELN